jgi:hypothetical protein
VWPLLVEVADVDAEDMLELAATEDQEAIEAIPTYAAHPAFRVGIRVRRADRCAEEPRCLRSGRCDPARADRDEEQHVQPAQPDRIDREEIAGEHCLNVLSGDERQLNWSRRAAGGMPERHDIDKRREHRRLRRRGRRR